MTALNAVRRGLVAALQGLGIEVRSQINFPCYAGKVGRGPLTGIPLSIPLRLSSKNPFIQAFTRNPYHKILKSGCRAEEARLRSADRLVKLISVLCLVSWRVFWMTMINRSAPDAEAGIVFT